MNQVKVHKIGLVIGGLLAIWHAVWALMVFLNIAKPFLDWIFGLHFLGFEYTVNPFSFGRAILLIVVTGVIGYLVGVVLGWLWNLIHRAAHNQ